MHQLRLFDKTQDCLDVSRRGSRAARQGSVIVTLSAARGQRLMHAGNGRVLRCAQDDNSFAALRTTAPLLDRAPPRACARSRDSRPRPRACPARRARVRRVRSRTECCRGTAEPAQQPTPQPSERISTVLLSAVRFGSFDPKPASRTCTMIAVMLSSPPRPFASEMRACTFRSGSAREPRS